MCVSELTIPQCQFQRQLGELYLQNSVVYMKYTFLMSGTVRADTHTGTDSPPDRFWASGHGLGHGHGPTLADNHYVHGKLSFYARKYGTDILG